ncbi:MAG: hypothetical protein IIV87_03390, partial [Oscillospiraceae bacterium]|nr:hypothetical protein [Oscillospiraceae bacterium]
NCKFNYQVQLTFNRLFTFFKANSPSFLIQAIALRILVHWIGIPEQVALILTLGITIPLSFILITKGMTKDSQAK